MRPFRPRSTSAAPPEEELDVLDDAFLRRLEGLQLRARRLTGSPAGGRPGRQRTPAADFIDHRPYSPGDDLRHVDWPAMARHDEVNVKVGHVRQATRLELMLDGSASMHGTPTKARTVKRLTAALGWLSLAAGDRTTLRAFPEPGGAVWGPGSGLGAGPSFLRAVGSLAMTAATSLATPALTRLAREAPAGGLVVLISDLWLTDDLDQALGSLPPPRWDVLVLQVLDRTELDPVATGPLTLVDSESGETVHLVVDDETRNAYRSHVRRRTERLRQIAARRGATHALIPADWPMERSIVPYLQRRALLVG